MPQIIGEIFIQHEAVFGWRSLNLGFLPLRKAQSEGFFIKWKSSWLMGETALHLIDKHNRLNLVSIGIDLLKIAVNIEKATSFYLNAIVSSKKFTFGSIQSRLSPIPWHHLVWSRFSYPYGVGARFFPLHWPKSCQQIKITFSCPTLERI